MRNKIRQKNATLCGSLLKVFSKGTGHESRRIPASNLKTLRGQLIQMKGKNKFKQKLKVKTPKAYTKTFFTSCILKNNSIKTAFYTTVKNLRGECKKQWKA